MNDDLEELLSRSISSILPSREALLKELKSGKKLRFYIGTDATGPQLHLGHSTNYLLLEKFRRLGHEVIFLFGDFTALIGDPTGKEAARKQQTPEEVEEHIKTWKSQAEKIVSFDDPTNPAKIMRNSEWLSKLNFENIIDIASSFTVQYMLERDMFEKRMEQGKPVYLHEFLYPLMQGYDSVAMNVDAEIGGTDQTFNMLAGRILQKRFNNKEKFVITTTLLENPVTKKKLMSKSEGNYIALNDSPSDMYGKVMALPDQVVHQMLIDTTLLPLPEIDDILKGHPKESKMRLAKEIVSLYYGIEASTKAESEFVKAFQEGGIPEDMATLEAPKGAKLVDVLVDSGTVSSKTEWRRLVSEGAVKDVETGSAVDSPDILLDKELVLRIGKHRFVRITL